MLLRERGEPEAAYRIRVQRLEDKATVRLAAEHLRAGNPQAAYEYIVDRAAGHPPEVTP